MKTTLHHYRMRAECQHDVGKFLQKIRAETITMRYTDEPQMPDVDVEFTSYAELAELQSMIRAIVDGHVMRESLNYADKYTGERVELTP